MKSKLLGTALALLIIAQASFAQSSGKSSSTYNHVEIGAFVNYTLLHNARNTNFFGAGGRIGVNVHPNIQLEAEGAYDFQRYVNADVSSSNFTFNSVRSNLRMAHFLFGPKVQLGTSGPVRIFVTAKGGLLNFSTDTKFTGQVRNIPSSDTDGVFYPVGGVEFFVKWVGLRFEAGDEMYFNNGVNHNLRVTAGPTFRF